MNEDLERFSSELQSINIYLKFKTKTNSINDLFNLGLDFCEACINIVGKLKNAVDVLDSAKIICNFIQDVNFKSVCQSFFKTILPIIKTEIDSLKPESFCKTIFLCPNDNDFKFTVLY